MKALSPRQKNKLVLVGGETHPQLSADIAKRMGLELGKITLRTHPNTELYARYDESIRGKHVIIMQPHAPNEGRSVSDSLHQHLEMIYAAKLASASQITAVSPNLAGTRQDRKAKGRESISAALNIKMLEMAGASRIVTVDLHAPQTQAIFDKPFDHITAQPLLRAAMKRKMTGDIQDYVVVSPDVGHSKISQEHAKKLGVAVLHLDKMRDPSDPTKVSHDSHVEGVEGKTCLIFDDMIDTAGTITSAAQSVHTSGAADVLVAATHAWFSGPAVDRIKDSPISQTIVTDTIPVDRPKAELGDALHVVTVADIVARTLYEIVTEGSVSEVFHEENYI